MPSNIIISSSSITILILVFSSFPSITFSETFTHLRLPDRAFGPESLAFEFLNFYTGTADGIIWKYTYRGGVALGTWSGYGFVSPNRSPNVCDGNKDPDKAPICGRPMGMGFNLRTRDLYLVDAYYGFLVVNPGQALARLIANGTEGVPFKSPNALDIDPTTENVFFTDASAVYELRNISQAKLNNDTTGRLMKYNPATKQIDVLMRNLSSPIGVGVSRDGSYVLVSEAFANRTQKFWLKGDKANTSEIFITQISLPNNIKRGLGNEFWIAATTVTGQPIGIRVDGDRRRILATVSLEQYGYTYATRISESQQTPVGLYVTSRFTDFIGVLQP